MNTPALRLAVVLLLLSAALTLLGVCVGSAGFEDLLGPLLQRQADAEQSALAAQIVWDIRLPRTLGAWTAGALLGLAIMTDTDNTRSQAQAWYGTIQLK